MGPLKPSYSTFRLPYFSGTTSILIIVIGIALILSGLLFPQTDASLKHHSILALLIIISHLILVINTVLYMFAASTILAKFRTSDGDANQAAEKQMIRRNVLFYGSYLLTIVLSGMILFWSFGSFGRGYDNWVGLYKMNEIFSLGIFLLFFLTDVMMFDAAKKALASNPNDQELQRHKKFIGKQIGFIGLPGFTGILIVVIITSLYYVSGLYGAGLDGTGNFVNGFMAGTIAMHILVTQVVFSVLMTAKS